MKKFLTILIIFSIASSCFACKKTNPICDIADNLTSYEINLDLNTETHSATATEKIIYHHTDNSKINEVKLHLYPQFFTTTDTSHIISPQKLANLYDGDINCGEYSISRVKVNDKDIICNYEGEFDSILSIPLSTAIIQNQSVNLYIEFNFTLPKCSHRYGYFDDTINLNNFYPIVCVCNNGVFSTNPYNANGDPFYSELSNYTISLSTDKEYIVASTGSQTKINDNTISLLARAVRDFSIVLSNKFTKISKEVSNHEISYYYYNDTNPNSSLDCGINALKTFEKLFGDYPYNNLSIVQSDFVFGGMEYPCLVMISDEIYNKDEYNQVIVHEIAHQWWYSVVGNDEYNFPWLDEALAEFSTALFYKYNDYGLTYSDIISTSQENYSLFTSVYQNVLGSIDTSMRPVNEYATEPEYTYCIYVKGLLMFDSLNKILGEKTILKCLKVYYDTYKFTNVTPDNLINSFSNTANKDLTNIFNAWTNGTVVVK